MNSIGKLAELKACDYLQKKKYILLEANYRSRFGEIDLIMNKGKYICFIEVKMRNEKFEYLIADIYNPFIDIPDGFIVLLHGQFFHAKVLFQILYKM